MILGNGIGTIYMLRCFAQWSTDQLKVYKGFQEIKKLGDNLGYR